MVSTESLSNLKQSHSNSQQVFSIETPYLKGNHTVKILLLCIEKGKELKPKAIPKFLNQIEVNEHLKDKSCMKQFKYRSI